ncbi:MAG: hypothetical protein AAGA77_09930 [Bacteroidota bacterium]
MKSITLLLLFLCISISQVEAQSNKSSNKDNYSQLDLQISYDTYSKYNVDFSLYEEYKKLGADLKNEKDPNIYEKSLRSSAVVIGKVTKKEYDTREEAYFHSIFTVEPITTIKGREENSGSFLIFQRAGSLGGTKFLQTDHVPLLEVGDQVLMFLEPAIPPTGFALERMNAGREKPFIFNSKNGYMLKFRDEIVNDFIISGDDVFNLKEAISVMKELHQITENNKK